MKKYKILSFLCTLLFTTSCFLEQDSPEKYLDTTMLLQYRLRTSVSNKLCFDNTFNLTKSFIRARTENYFLLEQLVAMDEKILTRVWVSRVRIIYAANFGNQATNMDFFVTVNNETEGGIIQTNEEITMPNKFNKIFTDAFEKALINNEDVTAAVRAGGCGFGEIGGYFKVDIDYKVYYTE